MGYTVMLHRQEQSLFHEHDAMPC